MGSHASGSEAILKVSAGSLNCGQFGHVGGGGTDAGSQSPSQAGPTDALHSQGEVGRAGLKARPRAVGGFLRDLCCPECAKTAALNQRPQNPKTLGSHQGHFIQPFPTQTGTLRPQCLAMPLRYLQ